jgi:hypothetical protein
MNETRKKINPWVFTLLLGVVTILFSVFAIQQEYDLDEAHKTIHELQDQLKVAQATAEAAVARAAQSAIEAERQRRLAEEALQQMQANLKNQSKSK